MTIQQILPELQSLSRVEKIRLIQFLAEDLARTEETAPAIQGAEYPIWSPYHAHEAAATILAILQSGGNT